MKYCFIINPRAGKGKFVEELENDILVACSKAGVNYEIFKTFGFFHRRRNRLCSVGAIMAGTQPQQYVSCGGNLFFAAGKAAKTAFASAAPGNTGFFHYHNSRIGRRSDFQPGLPGMGLPGAACQFSGADLSALQFAVGPGEYRRNGPVRHPGYHTAQ